MEFVYVKKKSKKLGTHLNSKTTPLFKWQNDFNVNKIILKNKTKNGGKMS
jgi:hypothetical protein